MIFLNVLMIFISFICLISSGTIRVIWKHWGRIRRLITLSSWETNSINLLFLRINLREPSILSKNRSCWCTFITTRLLSYLPRWVPSWFCSKHLLPTYKIRNFLAFCSVQSSSSIALLKSSWESNFLTSWWASAFATSTTGRKKYSKSCQLFLDDTFSTFNPYLVFKAGPYLGLFLSLKLPRSSRPP